MSTPTRVATANDLGERCQIVLGSFGYILKKQPNGEPSLRTRPQSPPNNDAVYISAEDTLAMRNGDRFSRLFLNDFRGGFGQTAFDPSDPISRRRFHESSGLNIHEQGRVSLSPGITATSGVLTSPSNPVPLLSTYGFLYAGVASAIYFHTDWSAPALTASTSTPGNVVALEQDGTYIYGVVEGVGVDRWVWGGAGAFTTGTLFASRATASSNDRILYANRLLYWATPGTTSGSVYSLSLSALPPVTPTLLFQLTPGWTVYDLTTLTGGTIESPILTLANNGNRTGLWYWDGVTVHDFVTFPVGFTGLKCKQYLGVIFVLGYQVNPSGTSYSPVAYYVLNGVVGFLGYLGSEQTNGNPTPDSVNFNGAYNIDAAASFVYFTVSGDDQECWRYDIVNGGLSRYMVLRTGTTPNVAGMVIYNNSVWASFRSTTNTALYGPVPHAQTFAASGWLTTSDLNLGQPWASNIWARIELSFAPLAAGESIAAEYSTDGGTTWTSADSSGVSMTTSTLGAKSATWLISNSDDSTASAYLRVRATLTAGTGQLTSPWLYAISLKAVPQEPTGAVIEVWVACPDRQTMPNGQDDWQGASGAERIDNIQSLYETQELVKVIYMKAGSTRAKNPTEISCLVDDYELWEYDTVGYRPGGGPPIGVEGDVRVLLREVT